MSSVRKIFRPAIFFLLGFFAVVFCDAATPAFSSDDRVLTISTQKSAQAEVAAAVLNEACSRIGFTVEYIFVPHRRSQRMAMSGQTDGELIRVEEYGKDKPELVRVPVPLCRTRSYAFARKDFSVTGWDDLRGLRIGILRGVLLSENNTQGMSLYSGSSPEMLMNLVAAGRLDAVVLSDLTGSAAARETNLINKVRPVGEPLADVPLYLYLNTKRADLVPYLSRALKEMELSGEGSAIRRTARAAASEGR